MHFTSGFMLTLSLGCASDPSPTLNQIGCKRGRSSAVLALALPHERVFWPRLPVKGFRKDQ